MEHHIQPINESRKKSILNYLGSRASLLKEKTNHNVIDTQEHRDISSQVKKILDKKDEAIASDVLRKYKESLRSKGADIQLNLRINNNYYNSHYNLQNQPVNHKDKLIVCKNCDEENKTDITSSLNAEANPVRSSNIRLASKTKMKTNGCLLSAPCMNCNQIIPLDDIDTHSFRCTFVTKEVNDTDKLSDEITKVNLSLIKLKDHLSLLNENKLTQQDGESYHIVTLLYYIKEVIKIGKSREDYNKIKSIFKNLNILILKFKGNFSVQLYLDRAVCLVKRKLKIIQSEIQTETKLEEELNAKQKKLKLINLEKDMLLNKINNLERSSNVSVQYNSRMCSVNNPMKRINKEMFVDVNSDCGERLTVFSNVTRNSEVSVIRPTIFRPSQYQHGDVNVGKPSEYKFDINQMYKDFVKLFLKIKFEELHEKDIRQKISDKALFDVCMSNDVPKENWREFILNEMKNADDYLKVIRKSKVQIKKMDTINEEEM